MKDKRHQNVNKNETLHQQDGLAAKVVTQSVDLSLIPYHPLGEERKQTDLHTQAMACACLPRQNKGNKQ